ncbi:hypothetical protein [Agrococcus casei]|uniref:hypothetical protein n=1 Tax=Agrococcus casei TaxID=343512 RepID=UPI003F924E3B
MTKTKLGRLGILAGAPVAAVLLLVACVSDQEASTSPDTSGAPGMQGKMSQFTEVFDCHDPLLFHSDVYGAIGMQGITCSDDLAMVWHYRVFESEQGMYRALSYLAQMAPSDGVILTGARSFAIVPMQWKEEVLALDQFDASADVQELTTFTDTAPNGEELDDKEFCMRTGTSLVETELLNETAVSDADRLELNDLYPGLDVAVEEITAQAPPEAVNAIHGMEVLRFHSWLSANNGPLTDVCL